MGRARGTPHAPSGGSAIPIIGLDYFFITRAGVKNVSELDFPATEEGSAGLEISRTAGEIVKCIVLRCSKSKVVMAHVVPCKGLDEDNYVLDILEKDLVWLGHTSMILKGDNERSIQAVLARLAGRVKAKCADLEQVSTEASARYDSQSNGLTEVGIMMIRGLFRSLKLCLESRIERRIPESHALISWLLQHTCLVLNACVKGPDGLTAWNRVRGRNFHAPMANFGEQVLYKLPSKGPLSDPDGNMGTRWKAAAYLGHCITSNTYVLGCADGITEARSIHRRTEDERWNADALANITATPWSLRDH